MCRAKPYDLGQAALSLAVAPSFNFEEQHWAKWGVLFSIRRFVAIDPEATFANVSFMARRVLDRRESAVVFSYCLL